MGSLISRGKDFEKESETWFDHSVKFDNSARDNNLKKLEDIINNTDLYLDYAMVSYAINFKHWFITDGANFIEFELDHSDIYKSRVTINTKTREVTKNKSVKMNDEIRKRISRVLGMNNFSLVLRNSEHVANYIFKNQWISMQMSDGKSKLFKLFKERLISTEKLKIVNTFPLSLRPHIFNKNENKNYSFLTDHFEAIKFDYYIDSADDTYNILMVGPTGAGKSNLINVIFNQPICDSGANLRRVTQDIYFVIGIGEIYDREKQIFVKKEVIVADTVGLCDAEWKDNQIIGMIKDRISSNIRHIDAVFVVFQAHRLSKECIDNIKKILLWLKYTNNSTRFVFVGTHADFISKETKNKLKEQFKEIFNIVPDTVINFDDKDNKFESFILTGFPPEDKLDHKTQKKVVKNLKELSLVLKFPGARERIEIEITPSLCNIF